MSQAWRPKVGDTAYLVPNTKTTAREAYDQPEVIVVAVNTPMVTVEFASGGQITTHERNLRATPPKQVHAKPRLLGGKQHHIDPKHGEELTFDLFGEGETA